MAVQVTKSDLSQKVQEGWKRKQLAEHYGLPETQMAQLLKDAGLQIRKFHAPKYVLVDDVSEAVAEMVQESESVQIVEEKGEEIPQIQSEQTIDISEVPASQALEAMVEQSTTPIAKTSW